MPDLVRHIQLIQAIRLVASIRPPVQWPLIRINFLPDKTFGVALTLAARGLRNGGHLWVGVTFLRISLFQFISFGSISKSI